jgi:hypothetical protein
MSSRLFHEHNDATERALFDNISKLQWSKLGNRSQGQQTVMTFRTLLGHLKNNGRNLSNTLQLEQHGVTVLSS